MAEAARSSAGTCSPAWPRFAPRSTTGWARACTTASAPGTAVTSTPRARRTPSPIPKAEKAGKPKVVENATEIVVGPDGRVTGVGAVRHGQHGALPARRRPCSSPGTRTRTWLLLLGIERVSGTASRTTTAGRQALLAHTRAGANGVIPGRRLNRFSGSPVSGRRSTTGTATSTTPGSVSSAEARCPPRWRRSRSQRRERHRRRPALGPGPGSAAEATAIAVASTSTVINTTPCTNRTSSTSIR